MQAAFGCCIPLLYTCAQDGLDTVQLVLVVFIIDRNIKIIVLINDLCR